MGGGSKQSSGTSTTTVKNELSPEQRDIMTRTMDVYMPGGQYTERPDFDPTNANQMKQGQERVAPFSQDTNNAFQAVRDRTFAHDRPMQGAMQATALSAAPTGQMAGYGNGWTAGQNGQANFSDWTSATAQRFMNPYTDNVIGTGMQELQRQHQIAQLGINDKAASAGAFGGSRHGVQAAETTRGFADMGQKFLSESLNTGYNQARDQYNKSYDQGMSTLGYNKSVQDANSDRLIKAASMSNELMRTNSDLNGASVNALGSIGAQQQQQNQNILDAAYDELMQNETWKLNLGQALSGFSPPPTTTTTGTATGGAGGSMWGSVGSAMAGSLLPKLFGGMFSLSDERAKDIKRKSGDGDYSDATKDIRALLDQGGIEYEYKPGLGQAPGVRKGFSAQAAEANGVRTEDIGGLKHVDMQSMLEKVTYAVADIDKRLEAISGKRKKAA